MSKRAQNVCPRAVERMSDVEVVEVEDCNSSEMTGSSKKLVVREGSKGGDLSSVEIQSLFCGR